MPGRFFEIPAELGIPGNQLIIGHAAPFGEFPIFNLLIATEVNWRKVGPFQARLVFLVFYTLFLIVGDLNRAVHPPHLHRLFGGEPEFLFLHSDNLFLRLVHARAKWAACCRTTRSRKWAIFRNSLRSRRMPPALNDHQEAMIAALEKGRQ